jgi:hypothetical protein
MKVQRGRIVDEATERHIRDVRAAIIEDWQPPRAPHCSNCLHAVVGGTPEEPTVRCERGHGDERSLFTLIRPSHSRQFIPAKECPDFSSMSDDGSAE